MNQVPTKPVEPTEQASLKDPNDVLSKAKRYAQASEDGAAMYELKYHLTKEMKQAIGFKNDTSMVDTLIARLDEELNKKEDA